MQIILKLIDKIKNLNKKIVKIMKVGFIFCFLLCLLSTIFLLTYETIYSLPLLYYIGLNLFKASLMFITMFLMCGIGFDTILNQI